MYQPMGWTYAPVTDPAGYDGAYQMVGGATKNEGSLVPWTWDDVVYQPMNV